VNIGVIVGAPTIGLRVRMAAQNERAQRWFGAEAVDDTRLRLITKGLAERLKEVEPTAQALSAFGAAEAGKLQVTLPRPMVVDDLDHDAVTLFRRLVDDASASHDSSPGS
jgi:hypothetical protein